MAHFQSAGFIDFLKNVVGSLGNTPGYPNQFKYIPTGKFHLETIPENQPIYPEPQYHIPREKREGRGPLNPMVSDVPFDYVTLDKTNRNLEMAGWAVLLVGLGMLL